MYTSIHNPDDILVHVAFKLFSFRSFYFCGSGVLSRFRRLLRFQVSLELLGGEPCHPLVIQKGLAACSVKVVHDSHSVHRRVAWRLVAFSVNARLSRQGGFSSPSATTGDHLGSIGGIRRIGISQAGLRTSLIVNRCFCISLTRPSHFSGRWTEQTELQWR